MDTVYELCARIEVGLSRYAPHLQTMLHSGATDEELHEAEAVLEVELPEDLKALYRLHNGSDRALLDGWQLSSIKQMIADWTLAQTVSGIQEEHPSNGPVRRVRWHRHWLPVMSNGAGDTLCLDLAPGPGGQVGQVIHRMHDVDGITLLAPSLWWYLAFFATEVEDGDYGLDRFGRPVSQERLSMVPIRTTSPEPLALPVSTNQIIERVAHRLGTSVQETARVVEALLAVMRDTLKAGEELRLVGFGSFSISLPAARTTLDLSSKTPVPVPAKLFVEFVVGQDLLEEPKPSA